jgi:WD40 repeat protein
VLAWSPDGRILSAGLDQGGIALIEPETRRVLRLPDYPAPVRSLDWSGDSRLLATAGAFRAIVWSLDTGDGKPKTIETGRAGFVAITVVRLHPHRPLLAVGYENGVIVIARIGARGLDWSPDSEHLAFHASQGGAGASQGSAGILDLPSHMFK